MQSDYLCSMQWFRNWYDSARTCWLPGNYCTKWNCKVLKGSEGAVFFKPLLSVFRLSALVKVIHRRNWIVFPGEQGFWCWQQFNWSIWCWILFSIPSFWSGIYCFPLCSPHDLESHMLIMFLLFLKVVVSTKSPKSDKQYVWEGKADASSYTIREETDPEKLIPRGTRLTLYLKVS